MPLADHNEQMLGRQQREPGCERATLIGGRTVLNRSSVICPGMRIAGSWRCMASATTIVVERAGIARRLARRRDDASLVSIRRPVTHIGDGGPRFHIMFGA